MSDEEKIQIAALGLLGLFNRKPKTRKSTPETKEDPGVIEPDSSDSSDSDDDELPELPELPDRPGAGSPPRGSDGSGGSSPPRGSGERSPPRESDGSGGRRETPEQEEAPKQEETPQQKLARIKSNPDNDMLLIAIGTLFDEIDRKNNGVIQLLDLVIAIKRNKRVQRIFGIDSIREGRNDNPVKKLFDKIDKYPNDEKLSRDELILFLFDDEQSEMLNMLTGTTEAIILAHRQYDVNQDGVISLSEYTRGFEQQGETIEDARENLLLTDIDKNGQLDIYEFARAVYGSSSVDQWYVDMINTNFERARRGELRADNMSRPYGPRTPPPRERRIQDIDMQPGRSLGDLGDEDDQIIIDRIDREILRVLELCKDAQETANKMLGIAKSIYTKPNGYKWDILYNDLVNAIINTEEQLGQIEDRIQQIQDLRFIPSEKKIDTVLGTGILQTVLKEQDKLVSDVNDLQKSVDRITKEYEKELRRKEETPKPIPPQREPIEPEKKKKAKKKTGLSNADAKQAALDLFTRKGLRIEDGEMVEYIVNRETAGEWKEIINEIEPMNKQARYVLFQAIVKGMYKIKTYEDDNINLADFKKILKNGGEGYWRGKTTTKGRGEQINQGDLSIVRSIIDDLEKGNDFFKKYIPNKRNPRNVKKPKKKKKSSGGETKTPEPAPKPAPKPAPNPLAILPILEPAVPSNETIINAMDDRYADISSSDESDDEEPQEPVNTPQAPPEVVVRSMSPTPGFDPAVQGLLDSLEPKEPSEQIEVVPTLVKYLRNTRKEKWTKFIWDDKKKGKKGTFMKWKSLARGKRATLFRDYAPVANTLEELKDLYATHMMGQGGVDVNLDWEDMVDRYAAAFLKDPAKMKEYVKKYAKRYFGYDVSDSDYKNIGIADRKGMAFLYGMPSSIKYAEGEIQKDADLFGLNLKPTMKLRF